MVCRALIDGQTNERPALELKADGSPYSFGSTIPFCAWYFPLRSL